MFIDLQNRSMYVEISVCLYERERTVSHKHTQANLNNISKRNISLKSWKYLGGKVEVALNQFYNTVI